MKRSATVRFAHPQILVLDRIGEIAAHAAAHQCRDVGVLQPGLVEVDELQPPQILAIHDREKRPRPLGPDEDVAERLPLVVLRGQIGNPQIDRHRPVDMRLAADFDAEQFAYRAGETVAADKILARTVSVWPLC